MKMDFTKFPVLFKHFVLCSISISLILMTPIPAAQGTMVSTGPEHTSKGIRTFRFWKEKNNFVKTWNSVGVTRKKTFWDCCIYCVTYPYKCTAFQFFRHNSSCTVGEPLAPVTSLPGPSSTSPTTTARSRLVKVTPMTSPGPVVGINQGGLVIVKKGPSSTSPTTTARSRLVKATPMTSPGPVVGINQGGLVIVKKGPSRLVKVTPKTNHGHGVRIKQGGLVIGKKRSPVG